MAIKRHRDAAVAALLPECSSHPTSVLLPIADTAPSTKRVEMLVATTRKPSSNPAETPTGEQELTLFGDIVASIPPGSLRNVGEVEGRRNCRRILRPTLPL